MKLYHARYILPALAAFLALATLPVWRSAAARGASFQSPSNPQGQRCIEPKSVMRASHMRLLMRWRDDVVREDRRVYIASDGRQWEKSLVKTCLACHGHVDANGKSTTAATACDECHTYVNVKPNCWNCHLDSAAAGVKTAAENATAPLAASKEEPR
jgi:hypothetical protein